MSARHTPGPWVVSDDGLVTGRDGRVRFAGTPSIDIFDASEWPSELATEAQANARLIAAAPDLLAALKELYGHAYGAGIPSMRQPMLNARAAIARAEGRTP